MLKFFDQGRHDDHLETGLNWRVAGVTQLGRKKIQAGFRRMGVVRLHLGTVVSKEQERLGREKQVGG